MGKGRAVYIITEQTKAILAEGSGYYRTRILEGNTEKVSIHRPLQIINYSCIVYGSSYEGRRTPVKRILHSASKLPIPVNVEKGIYMVPTASVKNKECVWVSYQHIDTYKQLEDEKLYITFRDGTGIIVPTSKNAFDMQFKRTSQVIVQMNRGTLFGKHWHPWW